MLQGKMPVLFLIIPADDLLANILFNLFSALQLSKVRAFLTSLDYSRLKLERGASDEILALHLVTALIH